MCLALLTLASHSRYGVIIAANRDEYHARPASPAHWWPEGWLAGRDLSAGGTWLGVTRQGRWALVTNVREPSAQDPQAPSRGGLVLRFLEHSGAPGDALEAIVAGAGRYNGFNLLAGDSRSAFWGSNRGPLCTPLAAGIYGLSNQQLDTPWPKVWRTKDAFARWCAQGRSVPRDVETLFALLDDRVQAPDGDLPATGVGTERERLLSAPFIVSDTYGTRSSTVLAIGYDGEVCLFERSFDAAGEPTVDVDFRFTLTTAATSSA